MKVRGPWINDDDCAPGSPMCHDCAFRKGSKELEKYMHGYGECNDDFYVVTSAISKDLRKEAKFKPFFCHHTKNGEDVPMDSSGTYLYDLDSRGFPKGVPVCNGWKAMVSRIRTVMIEDGEIEK